MANHHHQTNSIIAKINLLTIFLITTLSLTTAISGVASNTIAVRPSSGRATLIPGQPLNFQCEMIGNKDAQFLWFRKLLNQDKETMLEPNEDENIEIHNERLTLQKPNSNLAGDYYCHVSNPDKTLVPNEFAMIQVRTQPYIVDFGVVTSHTGKSSVVTDGDRLELTCTVRDSNSPVNITWLRSMTPDNEKSMEALPETQPATTMSPPQSADPFAQTYTAPDQSIFIEKVDNHTKRLVIESVKLEHRSYYVCMADNGVTERARKIILIRVKDKLVALWPALGIVAELFILFTIIYIWETQRAYKEIAATPPKPLVAASGKASTSGTGTKRPASGPSATIENEPLNSG